MKILRNPYFQIACQLIVGGVFIYAGIGKLFHFSVFREIVENYKLLPEFTIGIFSFILPLVELIAGVFLVLGFYKKPAAFVLSILLVVFICAVGFNLIRGVDFRCGCFLTNSNPEPISVEATHLILRDVGLLILCSIILIGGKKKIEKADKIKIH